jgi:hypothetical protein
MTKVYVLTSFYYDEGNIGVFSSREKAEAVMRDSDRVDQKDVQEFEVDELVGHVVMPTYIASIEKESGMVRESQYSGAEAPVRVGDRWLFGLLPDLLADLRRARPVRGGPGASGVAGEAGSRGNAMSKVYVLTEGKFSDYHIVGVFSTREGAEKVRAGYHRHQRRGRGVDPRRDRRARMGDDLVRHIN